MYLSLTSVNRVDRSAGMFLVMAGLVGAAQYPLSSVTQLCRNQPGDPGFPTRLHWSELSAELEGRLIPVYPSAKACRELQCTDADWVSASYRVVIPGEMHAVCPPIDNGTVCGQGNVPLYGINATTASHIQTGVKFAVEHNLRVVVKSSGHDFLGRSTQKNSLMLWTHYLKNVSFTDSFFVGDANLGSTVSVGSGCSLREVYAAAKEKGKYVVGGTAATVAAAGGYVQGAGHSVFSPIFGLAADNVLEFRVVLADGNLVTVNAVSHPDLFWALRGGGAGSWGVAISATFRTYPNFPGTFHTAIIVADSHNQAGALMAAHAEHIFDWDDVRAGQYFFFYKTPNTLVVHTGFANLTGDDARAQMAPFLEAAVSLGATVAFENTTTGIVNDIVTTPDDPAGRNLIMGSRLIPESTYRDHPKEIGKTYTALLDQGVEGCVCACCKVSENKKISSAVNPKWRTAKTHIVLFRTWEDTALISEIVQVKQQLTDEHVPLLAHMAGETDSGAYSNEADVQEPNFQETFFGPNYARLSEVKAAYDPHDLFIVGAGVGSERWDKEGMCRVV
ncbi:FAD-binding domain-containing protein [Artomyces pyxidatus]|uniref:FAD-binding domain-containing protein n=1 Tax=Artomyces pyxidatus TaxID=48021 RepID=A0ACB8T1F8_9AGAM|nr:FAD-binding domain-containing protein [Artomyces pyxidatus]